MKKPMLRLAMALLLVIGLLPAPAAEATLAFTVFNVNVKPSTLGGLRLRIVQVTLDASYASGGWAITAANVNLTTIKTVIVGNTGPATGSGGVMLAWDRANSKLKCYKSNTAATMQECGAGDASTLVAELFVVGN